MKKIYQQPTFDILLLNPEDVKTDVISSSQLSNKPEGEDPWWVDGY